MGLKRLGKVNCMGQVNKRDCFGIGDLGLDTVHGLKLGQDSREVRSRSSSREVIFQSKNTIKTYIVSMGCNMELGQKSPAKEYLIQEPHQTEDSAVAFCGSSPWVEKNPPRQSGCWGGGGISAAALVQWWWVDLGCSWKPGPQPRPRK